MLYVSSQDSASGKYGVTDTDDNTTEYLYYPQLFNCVQKLGVAIQGVDVKTGTVTKMKWSDREKRFVSGYASRLEFLRWNTGYDRMIEQSEGHDFTQYVVSMGGDVLTYRVYGSNGNYKIYER